MHRYQWIIDKALEHIQQNQLEDGSFLSLSSGDKNNFSQPLSYKTTFLTSNILLSLAQSNDARAGDICEKGIKFLLAQKSEYCSFNYWAADSKENITRPFPDDLDDTFAALAAIQRHHDELITGKDLANIVTLLTFTEETPGGPFKTWIMPKEAASHWRDVDIVVNSTVGYFLSLNEIQMPGIENFISGAIKDDTLTSPYYPNLCHSFYYISRFYKEQKKIVPDVKKLLLDKVVNNTGLNPARENLLEQAMTISSLINLGVETSTLSSHMETMTTQIMVSGFTAYPFCIDPSRDGKRYYSGASSITAALCLEAVIKYQTVAKTNVEKLPNWHKHIQDLAKNNTKRLGGNLAAKAIGCIDKTSDGKITGLIQEFSHAIKTNNKTFPLRFIEKLSLANLYGWMAYTIYDNIADESLNIDLLPCANLFLQELIDIFCDLDKEVPGAKNLLLSLLDIINDANVWEYENCKAPSTAAIAHPVNLANKSIGHAIGPMTLLLHAGYPPDSEETKNMMSFFTDYLIARQLHDDAHDWEKDLQNKRVNSVCAMIMNIKMDDGSPEERRTIFQNIILGEVSKLIEYYVNSAEVKISQSLVFKDTQILSRELSRLRSAAQNMPVERRKALDFLNNYA